MFAAMCWSSLSSPLFFIARLMRASHQRSMPPHYATVGLNGQAGHGLELSGRFLDILSARFFLFCVCVCVLQ